MADASMPPAPTKISRAVRSRISRHAHDLCLAERSRLVEAMLHELIGGTLDPQRIEEWTPSRFKSTPPGTSQ